MKKLFVLFVALIVAWTSHAQENDSTTEETDEEDKRGFLILPAVFYSPETSLGFGVAGIVYFRPKNEAQNLKPSNVQSILIYTLERQVLITAPYNFFLKAEEYWLNGQFEYNIYPYEYYGTGTDISQDEFETYTANFVRLELNALKQIKKDVYLGPTVFMDNYFSIETDPDGELSENEILGIRPNTVFGLGLSFTLDRRNNIFSPVDGYYLDSRLLVYEEKVLGDYGFGDLYVDMRKYFHPFDTYEAGIQFYHQTILGTPPFYNYALLGGGKLMRGYYKGAYRDNHQAVLQGEIRRYLFNRIILSAFGGMGSVSDTFFGYNKLLGSYGLGLRFEINKEEHLRIRLDYARGLNTDGIYININEAF